MIKEERATLATRCFAKATLDYQTIVTVTCDHNA